MEHIHVYLAVVYYGFGILFLVYEYVQKRKQEKRLAKALDSINKSLLGKNPE